MYQPMQAAPAPAGGYKLPFPYYKGRGTPEECDAFVRKYETWCRRAGLDPLNPQQSAEMVATLEWALQDDAANWLMSVRCTNPAALHDWAHIRAEMLTRFGTKRTPSELAAARAELKQKHEETVQAFMDRCHVVQGLFDDAIPTPPMMGPADKTAWAQAQHNTYVTCNFICGLKEEIKKVSMPHEG